MFEYFESLKHLYGGYGQFFFQSGVPIWLLYGAIALFVMAITFWLLKSLPFREVVRKSSVVLLIELIAILYCSTVIFRRDDVVVGYKLMPFWSYFAITEGKESLMLENILNVLVFIPIGFLCGMTTDRKQIKFAVAVGMACSVVIELSQYCFERGFAETDDVIHNTIGCLIGCLVYMGICKCISIVRSKINCSKKSSITLF